MQSYDMDMEEVCSIALYSNYICTQSMTPMAWNTKIHDHLLQILSPLHMVLSSYDGNAQWAEGRSHDIIIMYCHNLDHWNVHWLSVHLHVTIETMCWLVMGLLIMWSKTNHIHGKRSCDLSVYAGTQASSQTHFFPHQSIFRLFTASFLVQAGPGCSL